MTDSNHHDPQAAKAETPAQSTATSDPPNPSAKTKSLDEITHKLLRQQVDAVNAYFREHPDAEVDE